MSKAYHLRDLATHRGSTKEASLFGDIGGSLIKGTAAGVTGAAGSALMQRLTRPSLLDRLKQALLVGGAAAGAGGALSLGADLVSSAKDKHGNERNIRRFMSANPELTEGDPAAAREILQSLHTFSPSVARDPLASRSAVKRLLQYKDEGIQPQELAVLSNIEKSRRPDVSLGIGKAVGDSLGRGASIDRVGLL